MDERWRLKDEKLMLIFVPFTAPRKRLLSDGHGLTSQFQLEHSLLEQHRGSAALNLSLQQSDHLRAKQSSPRRNLS